MRIKHLFLIWLFCFACAPSYRMVEHMASGTQIVRIEKTDAVIFSESVDCFLCSISGDRFNPTKDDILLAEHILNRQLKQVNTPAANQGNGCPIIHKNLAHYRRQYFGYVTKQGNRVLFATFNWNQNRFWQRLKGYDIDTDTSWRYQRTIVSDGCSYHWTVIINLSLQQLEELHVNGGG